MGAVLGLLVFLGLVLSAHAADVTLARVQHLYDVGNFRAAALGGASMATPDSLALAARARLVRAAYLLPPDRAKAELDKAEVLARAALKRDPHHFEASLQLAIALGYRARVQGYVNAHFNGLATEGRALIDRALRQKPGSAWAHAIMGAWHAEIVQGAGSGLAGALYNAGQQRALKAFDQAVRLAPENAVIRLEYAKALIKLKHRQGWPPARAQLRVALKVEPDDHLAALLQKKAAMLAEAIDTGDRKTVRRTLKTIEPFTGN